MGVLLRRAAGGWLDAAREVGGEARSLGVATGTTLLVVFGLGKLAELAIALHAGHLAGFGWAQLAGSLAMVAEDLLAALLLGACAGGLAWLTRKLGPRGGPAAHPRRAACGAPFPWVSLLAVWLLLLLPLALLTLLGVALYRLYQTPLTFGQVALLGGLADLRSAVRENLGLLTVSLGLLLPAIALLGMPLLGRGAVRWLRGWLGRRAWRWQLPLVVLLPASSYLLLPERSLAGLELNPAVELVRSALRTSRPAAAGRLELGPDPHYALDRVFDPADPRQEDPAALANVQARPPGPMNLLLVVGESWAASQHCFLGGPPEACPRLQGLRAHTLTFSDYYCITPVSMKSLFSITCSLNPIPIPQAETYVHGNIDCRSISEVLKDEGYATAALHGGHFSYSDKLRYLQHRRYDVLRDGETLRSRRRYPLHGWGADDRAVRDDFLEWHAGLKPGTPWHALLIPVTPHYPYQPLAGHPETFGKATLRDRYLNQMVLQDQIIGDIWDELQRRGELERTLIVLVGDHGQAFEEHPGNAMHGSYIYEESVRVPLIFLHPTMFSGKVSQRLGNHLDLAPTVLELMGREPVPRWEGRSLLGGYVPHRVHFFTRYAHYQLGLRDGRYKFIHDKDRGSFELFDLRDDPGERQNLAPRHPEIVRRYQELTDRWELFYQELIPHYETYRLAKGPCRGKPSCFLDELQPTFVHGKAEARRSAMRTRLAIGGRTYDRGWGVEAPSILRFSVVGLGFAWLTGVVGHDDDIYAGQLGETVSAEIYVDDELVFSSGKLKKGVPPVPFRIPIEGARVIELYGYDMDGIPYRDNIDWVEMKLTRE